MKFIPCSDEALDTFLTGVKNFGQPERNKTKFLFSSSRMWFTLVYETPPESIQVNSFESLVNATKGGYIRCFIITSVLTDRSIVIVPQIDGGEEVDLANEISWLCV